MVVHQIRTFNESDNVAIICNNYLFTYVLYSPLLGQDFSSSACLSRATFLIAFAFFRHDWCVGWQPCRLSLIRLTAGRRRQLGITQLIRRRKRNKRPTPKLTDYPIKVFTPLAFPTSLRLVDLQDLDFCLLFLIPLLIKFRSMSLFLVVVQQRCWARPVRTIRAGKWFLSAVCPHVIHEIFFLSKFFATYTAGEIALFSVDYQYVLFQSTTFSKCLLTNCTLIFCGEMDPISVNIHLMEGGKDQFTLGALTCFGKLVLMHNLNMFS